MISAQCSKAKGEPTGSREAAGAYQAGDIAPPANSVDEEARDESFNPQSRGK